MTIRSVHRGFTLIEVLLATFVIALGVLGLLAMFAGAAKQQQVSSQETGAVFAARAAQGTLREALSNMQLRPSGCSMDAFTPYVWNMTRIDPEANTVRLAAGNDPCSPYAKIKGTPAVLFQAPPPPSVESPGTTHAWGFPDGAGPEIASTSFEFADRRIEPDSLNIEVVYSFLVPQVLSPDDEPGTLPTGHDRVLQPPIIFSRPANGAGFTGDRPEAMVYTENADPLQDPGGILSGDPASNFMRVNPETVPFGSSRARIVEMQIGAVRAADPALSARIESVRAVAYQWRDDTVVSLNDRVRTRSDASAPKGRRPDQSYSVLFRTTPTGSQAILLSYQLTATSATAEWIPPETDSELLRNLGPIRRIVMNLYQDADDPTQFYFRALEEKDLWAIAPGQILVIEGSRAGGTPGSDRAVRIVRQTRERADQGGRWRGYVDRMPRLNDRAALPPNRTVAGPFNVLGVADTVRSRADGSIWKLTPLVATDFSVGFSN